MLLHRYFIIALIVFGSISLVPSNALCQRMGMGPVAPMNNMHFDTGGPAAARMGRQGYMPRMGLPITTPSRSPGARPAGAPGYNAPVTDWLLYGFQQMGRAPGASASPSRMNGSGMGGSPSQGIAPIRSNMPAGQGAPRMR